MNYFYRKFTLTVILICSLFIGCISHSFASDHLFDSESSNLGQIKNDLKRKLPSEELDSSFQEEFGKSNKKRKIEHSNFVFAVPDQPKFITTKKYFRQGFEANASGNYDKALQFYNKAVATFDFDNNLKYSIYYHWAIAQNNFNFSRKDLTQYKKVVEVLQIICRAPEAMNFLKVKANFYVGSILGILEDREQEVKYYKKALVLAKDNEMRCNILYNLGLAYKDLEQIDQTLDCFDTLSRAHKTPKLSRVYANYELGLIEYDSDSFKQAIEYFNMVTNLINQHNMQDETEFNKAHYRNLEFNTLYHCALAQIALKEYPQASRALLIIIKNPRASKIEQKNALYQLGLLEAKQNNHEAAIKYYDCLITLLKQNEFATSVSEQDGFEAIVLNKRGLSKTMLNKNEDGINDLKQALEVPKISDITKASILFDLGQVNYKLKNFAQAIKMFEKILEISDMTEKFKKQVLRSIRLTQKSSELQLAINSNSSQI